MAAKKRPGPKPTKHLYRVDQGKLIAGVAAGIAEFFEIDPTIVRLLFLALIFVGGSGIFLYIILWLVLPGQSNIRAASKESISDNVADIRQTTELFGKRIHSLTSTKEKKFWWGAAIVVIGLLFLFHNFDLLDVWTLGHMWPFLLILLGWAVLARK